jgi:Cu/Ag efflux protein CusF
MRAITCGAAVLLTLSATTAMAQTKVITGETKTATATVEAIEASTRQVTVKKADGTNETFYVPTSMKRFDQLKVGDKITARYYENIVLQLKQAGSPDVDKSSGKLVPVEGAPAGTMSYQRTITATITALDPNVPSIQFSGPNGWKYSSKVQDKAALAKVKVGDKVDITWTYAVLMAIE